MQSRLLNEQVSYTTGRINPLLGGASAARNTRFEQVNRVTEQDRAAFAISSSLAEYLQQLVMGTYVRGQLVNEYFLGFAADQMSGALDASAFARAV